MSSPRTLFAFFLALNMAVSVFGISCHRVNDWSTSTVHDRHFCTAYFEVGDGHASFGGSRAHPKDLQPTFRYDFLNEADCQLQTDIPIMTIPGETTSIWACICYESFCNFPFSFEEFSRRGHTLRPSFVPSVIPADDSSAHH
ncbi:hypothetical protein GCK72_026023 [Caenorhabditis remanei]|uniref:Uncharacterized protein n=1 Tax=Caenorhabditis remanei TaxID=31234 RepID=A0A2P4VNJ8_CAERE|nr:hypothetical protein GCK72_026023 [Caenorhabditis remanei]KAF1749555.1 hypothetical protein GCK72_026023 [Caenorhabditis remanei]